MYKKQTILVIFCAILLNSFSSYAEDVPTTSATNSSSTTITLGISEVSLIKVSSDIINLQLNQQDAGLSVETSTSDSTARLLMSSVISSSMTRSLSAAITAGTVPAGTHLELSALQPNSNFAGETGTFIAPTTLDGTNRPIITNIASCYSGKGASDGYPLKFSYTLDVNPATYGILRATAGTQIVVTFTLTAVSSIQ
jgi:hypothetical protein